VARLDSAVLKLHRAHHHYVVMRDEEIQRRRSYALTYPLTPKTYRDGLEYRFYIGEIPPIDEDRWSTAVGDCLFNLRAALDHIVYALHDLFYSGSVPADAERAAQFPVLNLRQLTSRGGTLGKPRTDTWNEINRLSEPQRAAIEELQPYRRSNNGSDPLDVLREVILAIHELNIVDKHRHLHVVRTATFALGVPTFPDEYGFENDPNGDALESHAEIDRWTFTSIPPNIAEQVNVHREVYAEIAIEESGQFTDVLYTFQSLVTQTGHIIERFAKWFPQPTTNLNVPIAESIFDAFARMRKAREI